MSDAVKKWIEALRSGEYTQVQGSLHKPGQGHCCLGVACEVAVKEGVIAEYDGDSPILPLEVQNWLNLWDGFGTLGIDAEEPESLIDANDNLGLNFEQIASLIERNPKGLFDD